MAAWLGGLGVSAAQASTDTSGEGTAGGPAWIDPGGTFMQTKLDVMGWADDQLAYDDGVITNPRACPRNDPCPTSDFKYLSEAIHKEGAGNACAVGSSGCSSIGHPYYTCSAAATRNMVQTFAGADMGEAWFVTKFALTSAGLNGINRIPNVLNSNWGNYGTWRAVAPTSVRNYQAGVMTDVGLGEPVVQDVHTGYLGYFHGKNLKHYDMVYGYNRPNRTVAIAEEWDPVFTFGVLPSDYQSNPYGEHPSVPRGDGYQAVINSVNGKYVL
jgi:hypothetical protein